MCAFLYLPIRLIQAANPEWTLVSWSLTTITIGLTFCLLRLVLWAPRNPSPPRPGRGPGEVFDPSSVIRTFAFPLCFFLVAVPWPFVIESAVVQGLTRLNTAATIEILSWLGIPALQHGNVIEVATGSVGIDEACSGIRSLQATLMLSLFFGEFYRLVPLRRVLLCFAGFGIAMICNLGRTVLLTWVASDKGVNAISSWHDPAGVSILLACFIGVWSLGVAFSRKQPATPRSPLPSGGTVAKGEDPGSGQNLSELSTLDHLSRRGVSQEGQPPSAIGLHSRALAVPVLLLTWLLLVELGVASWYRHVESNLPAQTAWHLTWPVQESAYREFPVAKEAAALLRYDDAKQAQWQTADGLRWQLSWFYWKPGRAAAYLAKGHNPMICMPASGFSVTSVSPAETADINGLRFPFRRYSFEREGSGVHILYGRWDERAVEQPFASEGVSRFNRLRSIWTGRGNHGQRVVSLAVWGAPNPEKARELLLDQLRQVLAVDGR